MNSPTRLRPITAAAVGCLLLAGCSTDSATPIPPPNNVAGPSASVSSSASASASPTPTSTLSPTKQQAVDEAAAVVLAYEQMLNDLPADPEPYLNDLNNVAAQPQLALDLFSLRQILVKVAQGDVKYESTGPVTITSVEPLKVDLKGDPPTVTLLVCVDNTAASGTQDGQPWTGPRQSIRYRVVKTTYLPSPGWAVAKVLPPKGHDQPQPC